MTSSISLFSPTNNPKPKDIQIITEYLFNLQHPHICYAGTRECPTFVLQEYFAQLIDYKNWQLSVCRMTNRLI